MNFLRAYTVFFQNPNWPKNLLLMSVTALIPYVGVIVLMGYGADFMALLTANPNAVPPNYDFNSFGRYLKRGLWPFLVSLVLGLLLIPFFVLYMILFVVVAVIAGNNNAPDLIPFLNCCGMLLWLPAILLLNIITVPVLIRAVFLQDFKAAFNLAFAKDFLKRTFGAVLLEQLFVIASSVVLGIAGMLVLCVGLYAAVALVTLAQYILMWMLYDLYLQRGGTPLQVVDPPSPGTPGPAFPVQGNP